MRVVSLKMSNFRSFASEQMIVFPDTHLVLVGSNNAGKSNVLTALDWALGNSTPYVLGQRAESDDYFNPAKPITIEVVLGGVTAADKARLMALATNKQQRGALNTKQDPKIVLTLMLPPLVHPTETEGDDETHARTTLDIALWGFKVFKRQFDIRKSLVQLVRVPSDRRPDQDLTASRWTPYGQLMGSVLEGAPQYGELKDLLGDVNKKIKEAFADQKKAMLSGAQVVSYVDDIDFQLTKDNNPIELLRNLEIFVTEDGRKINLDRLGTGTQSAVIIGLLELVLRAKTSQAKVFAVEEPDAFIHPHGVRHLANLIKRIGEDPHSQIVLSTHSPSLLATLGPGDVVRIEKQSGGSVVYQSPGTLADPVFARFVNQDNAEMFFANRVILVEGATERFLLPPLAKLIVKGTGTLDFGRSRTSVVELEGKSSILNFLRILDEYEIERKAVLDKDFLSGPDCSKLVRYLRGRGITVDDSSSSTLTRDLAAAGILVLDKGEIENYLPEGDIATVSGKSLAEVEPALSRHPKASDALKKLFGTTKPIYARRLAEYYTAQNRAPADLERLIKLVAP